MSLNFYFARIWNYRIHPAQKGEGIMLIHTSPFTHHQAISQVQAHLQTLLFTWEHFPGYWPFVHSHKANDSGFDVINNISLNKLFNKQSSCHWFKMPWCSADIILMLTPIILPYFSDLCGFFNNFGWSVQIFLKLYTRTEKKMSLFFGQHCAPISVFLKGSAKSLPMKIYHIYILVSSLIGWEFAQP